MYLPQFNHNSLYTNILQYPSIFSTGLKWVSQGKYFGSKVNGTTYCNKHLSVNAGTNFPDLQLLGKILHVETNNTLLY